MNVEGVFNYPSFFVICDMARQHGTDPLDWILHMLLTDGSLLDNVKICSEGGGGAVD